MRWSGTDTAPAATPAKARDAASAASVAQTAASDPSTAQGPGLAAHTAPIAVQAGASTLTLVPDAGLLHAKDTVWPVFVDPTYSWHSASGGKPAFDEVKQDAPCNGASYYNDYSEDGNGSNLAELGAGYEPSAYSSTCGGDLSARTTSGRCPRSTTRARSPMRWCRSRSCG